MRLRTDGFDIDHIIPVKCGWIYRIPAEALASVAGAAGLYQPIDWGEGVLSAGSLQDAHFAAGSSVGQSFTR